MAVTACPECGTQVTAGDLCPLCGTPTPAPAPPPPPAADASPPAAGQKPPASPTMVRYQNQWEAILEKLRRVVAPRYSIRSILGYGGMAGVYLADEPRLGRQVAIKVMSPGLMVDPKLVERFEQEARTIAQFTHPHIVTIYEVDEREDLHYFTMTYVAGRTLGQAMSEATGPLAIDVIRAWLYQIGDALAYAHHHGVVHRDVKPGNVLLDLRGNALVTDFGIAKVADVEAGLTRTGMLVGTPAYMSPEQCSSGKVTGASDQYSLGAVAYQMITGQPPFHGATLAVLQAHVGSTPPPIRDLRPDCPDDLLGAVTRMLEKRPEDRWPSMSAAVAAAGASPTGLDGSVRGQMEMLAAQAAGISVSPWFEVVREGSRESLTVHVVDANGNVLRDRRVEWKTDDQLVATVVDGQLMAVCPGNTRVEVTCGAARSSLELMVEADPVPGIAVEPAEATLPTGGRMQLEAVVNDWDGSRIEDRVVLWSSADSNIVRVLPDGTIEGIRGGETVITASTGRKSAAVNVTVTAETLASRPAADAGRAGATMQTRDRAARSSPGTLPPASRTPPPSTPSPQTPAPASKRANAPAVATASSPAATGGRKIGRAAIGAAIAVIAVTFALLKPWQRGASGDADPTLQQPDPGGQPAIDPDDPPMAQGTPATPTSGVVNEDSLARLATAARDSVRRDSIQRAEAQRLAQQQQQQQQRPPAGRAAQPPPQQQTERVVEPPRPTTGTVEIGGNVPAGTSVTLRQPNGQTRAIAGRSVTLSPGSYTLEFSASGWEIPAQRFQLDAGDTLRVTVTARQLPPPTNTLPAAAAPVRNVREDQTAIESAVRAYIAAFNRRDAAAVVPLLPTGDRDTWRTLLLSRDVTDFSATAGPVEPASVDGDSGTVRFSMQLAFRNRNQTQRPVLRFTGTAQRDGSGWRLASLRPNN